MIPRYWRASIAASGVSGWVENAAQPAHLLNAKCGRVLGVHGYLMEFESHIPRVRG
jgi:hypothetical protein